MKAVIAAYARSPFQFARKGRLAECGRTRWQPRLCRLC
jgi:hypothetical protein